MDGYIQTAIGVFISIVLFLVGYRQTIGARRERVASANRAVYKAVLRRLVLEEYSPKLEDLTRLMEGKAQDYKVSPGDLHSDEQLLNQVFAEIFDNDFIAPDKRIEIEKRLAVALDQLSKGKQKIDDLRLASPDQEKRRNLLLAVMALFASLMGAIASIFLLGDKVLMFGADIGALKTLFPAATVFVASLLSVVAISFVKRAREADYGIPLRSSAAYDAAHLELQVAKALMKQNIPFEIQPKIGLLMPDFLAKFGAKRVVIEVKSWRSIPPVAVVSRVVRYMQELLKSGVADHAVIVTGTRVHKVAGFGGVENLQFVSIKEFEDWLRAQQK